MFPCRIFLAFAIACPLALSWAQHACAESGATIQLAQQIQRQEEQRRQELLKKNLQDQLKDERDKVDRAKETARAQLLYRNLVTQQGLSHEQALEALKRAGYPTGGIKPLP